MYALQDTQTKENKKKAFEILWSGFPVYRHFTLAQLYEICEHFKIVSFNPGMEIVHKDEEIEWFGIILSGNIAAKSKEITFEIIQPGDMIGAMGICGYQNNLQHKFTLIGQKDGFLAVITINELQILAKANPSLVFL